MIRGIDRFVEHEGRRYLVECEDLGTRKRRFEVRVLEQGEVLWTRSFSYEVPPRGARHSLREVMERVYWTTRAAIARGRFA